MLNILLILILIPIATFTWLVFGSVILALFGIIIEGIKNIIE